MNEINKILTKYNIINFTESEILKRYKWEDIPKNLRLNIIPTLCATQVIRTQIGVPATIVSAYRNKEHNEAAKGSSDSMHLSFNAFDLRFKNFVLKDYKALANQIRADKFKITIEWKGDVIMVNQRLMGIGIHNSFIHIDTRGLLGRPSPAQWSY